MRYADGWNFFDLRAEIVCLTWIKGGLNQWGWLKTHKRLRFCGLWNFEFSANTCRNVTLVSFLMTTLLDFLTVYT